MWFSGRLVDRGKRPLKKSLARAGSVFFGGDAMAKLPRMYELEKAEIYGIQPGAAVTPTPSSRPSLQP